MLAVPTPSSASGAPPLTSRLPSRSPIATALVEYWSLIARITQAVARGGRPAGQQLGNRDLFIPYSGVLPQIPEYSFHGSS